MSFEGGDPVALGLLSKQLQDLSNVLEQHYGNVGSALENAQWSGPSASHAESLWHGCGRLLQTTATTVKGLSGYVGQKAQMQSQAGSASGSGASGSGSFSSGAKALFSGVQPISKDIGPIAGPIVGTIPLVGGLFGQLSTADTGFRAVQDARDGDYQGLFNESSNLAAGAAFDTKNPAGFLVGTNITLWNTVEQDGRAINWSYTVTHLSQLNPFAPGALSSVYHAEVQGLTAPFETIVGGAITSFTP